MMGCNFQLKKREWVTGLLRSKFFGSCVDHENYKKKEKNMFCIDCNISLCKYCVTSSAHDCVHRLLQICKYVYENVVRLQDIQKHLDCSQIQAYKINGEKAVHLKPRPQLKDAKNSKAKGGCAYCEACGRYIQDLPNRFCSIACKVSIEEEMMKINRSHNIISVPMTKVFEFEENGSCDSSFSLTESSEVIQAWVSSSSRPKKRKQGFPRRAPLR